MSESSSIATTTSRALSLSDKFLGALKWQAQEFSREAQEIRKTLQDMEQGELIEVSATIVLQMTEMLACLAGAYGVGVPTLEHFLPDSPVKGMFVSYTVMAPFFYLAAGIDEGKGPMKLLTDLKKKFPDFKYLVGDDAAWFESAMKLEAGSLASEGKPYDPSFAMTDPSAEVNPQQISLDIQEKSTVSTYVSSQEAAKM